MEPLMTEAVGRITPPRNSSNGSWICPSPEPPAYPAPLASVSPATPLSPPGQLMLERTQFAYRNPKEVF